MSKDDFASLMESSSEQVRMGRRLRQGQVVQGTVVQIGKDSVFLDVGATAEGRIERGELEDKSGKLSVALGDTLSASVVSVSDVAGPVLSVALGKGTGKGRLDMSALESARDGGIPVTGNVQRAVKGGIEVDISGVRAFCPASQIDTAYIADLNVFVGQSLTFRVIEIKDGGKSVVLSRKALLEEEKNRAASQVLESLKVGEDYQGNVTSVQKYGAFVDLGGGVEGLVHVSELAHSRVAQVQDVLSVGETITVRLLGMEPADKGAIPKLRLSLKARQEAPPEAKPGQVLTGTVSRLTSFGVFVDTPSGSGLVPVRELGIPRGADFRKQFPVGKEVKVVLVNRDDSRKTTYSIARVADVEERHNYQEFTSRDKPSESSTTSMGSFGQLLQQKLGISPAPAAAAPEFQRSAEVQRSPDPQPPAPSAPRFFQSEVASEQPASPRKPLPPGMVRRKG